MSANKTTRSPRDGKPYYCDECGVGWAEYMVCEDGPCRLETEAEAHERQRLLKIEREVTC